MSKLAVKQANSRTIPALNGLRALAVSAVILYHLFPAIFKGGYIGVDIFFVISGFLITTLLIGEHLQYGRIALKKFWTRRARRLLPALFTTILAISSVAFFIRGDILVGIGQQILGASTFSSNWVEVAMGTNYFVSTSSHIFMNFWSLAVEEQFYLIWPLITIILVAKINKPWAGLFSTGIMALASASWMAYLYSNGATGSRVYYGTDTHVFGLMLGALLAYLSYATLKKKITRRLFQPFSFTRNPRIGWLVTLMGVGALAGLGSMVITLSYESPFTYIGGLFLASILSATLLIAAAGKRGMLQKAFEFPLLNWLGSRSYGIYLWHWPLIVLGHFLIPSLPAWLFAPLVIITTLSIAELSYRFIETPVRTHGFRIALKKSVKKQLVAMNASTMRIRRRPHSVALLTLLAVILTIASVVTAPTKTAAQLRIEAGERLVEKQALIAKEKAKNTPPPPITDGTKITAIGDSVMLASSPALDAKYPGILINAEVSRSLRRGGLETVQQFQANGQLRDIVIIALGTNGYYGTGGLNSLISTLAGHKIVLVTAHADREWISPNNQEVEAAAKKNKNIVVAEWDQLITPHPDFLAEDGVHPTVQGDALYIEAIQAALSKLR